MKIFGDKAKFAIEYQLTSSPYEEEELLKKSWGILKLWIEARDVCQYVVDGSKKQYEWNLIYAVEWLCNNLEYVLGYDPFPLPIQGKNTLELINESDKFESDEDDEFYLWYQAKNSWTYRHSWFSNRAGSMLSNVYFRRVNDDIEISWNNGFFEDNQVVFVVPVGVYTVSKTDFKATVFDFLKDILEAFETALGGSARIGEQSVVDLRRRVSLLE